MTEPYQIRITARVDSGRKLHEQYPMVSSVDQSWKAMFDVYTDLIDRGEDVEHIFWKGPGHLDTPSAEIKELHKQTFGE